MFGQYLTIRQACFLTATFDRPLESGTEPFEAYYASNAKIRPIADERGP